MLGSHFGRCSNRPRVVANSITLWLVQWSLLASMGMATPVGVAHVETSPRPPVLLAQANPLQVPAISPGVSFEEAVTSLRRLDVGIQKKTEPSATVPAGRFIRTDPPANTTLDRRLPITVFISSGPPPPEQFLLIPPFNPQPHQQVVDTLIKDGFRVEETWSEPSSQPAGYFTRTEPPAGTQVAPGSSVVVHYSNGPPPTQPSTEAKPLPVPPPAETIRRRPSVDNSIGQGTNKPPASLWEWFLDLPSWQWTLWLGGAFLLGAGAFTIAKLLRPDPAVEPSPHPSGREEHASAPQSPAPPSVPEVRVHLRHGIRSPPDPSTSQHTVLLRCQRGTPGDVSLRMLDRENRP